MEWHRDHWFDRRKIYFYHAVIVSDLLRLDLSEIFTSAVNVVKFFYFIIGSPDGRQTGCLCCHNVNADTVIYAQVVNSIADKFHYFIINITIFKYSTDNCQCDILRTDTLFRFSGKMDGYDTRHRDIIRLFQKLFYDLRTTFTHCHRTKGTITGMAVGAKNHFTAAGKHFAGKLVNDCLMRWYIDSTVFLCTGKTKYMIVFIDGSPYCT